MFFYGIRSSTDLYCAEEENAVRVYGTVKNSRGEPIPDATVKFKSVFGIWSNSLSDSTGMYELQLGEDDTSVEGRYVPEEFALRQNYPNPFNPSTTIEYELKQEAYVKLDIYNISGQLVRNLRNGSESTGIHAAVWDGSDNEGRGVASGIYFYNLTVGDFRQTKKMLLLDGASQGGLYSGSVSKDVSGIRKQAYIYYSISVEKEGYKSHRVSYFEPPENVTEVQMDFLLYDESDALLFYISVDGSDENSGIEDEPFKTITKAVTAARALKTDQPKKIVIGGGIYYDVEVSLNAQDSGMIFSAAPGETPVLYGGRLITGWEPDGEFYAAPLDGVKEGTWDFRSIVVENELRFRARLPETGAYTHLSEFNVSWLGTSGGGWARTPTAEELTTMIYSGDDLGSWLDINNAELTIFHSWDESVVGIRSLDTATHTVKFKRPAEHPPGAFGAWVEKAKTYIVWNIREGMLHPGQWYLDRTEGKLVYWPMPGEDITEIDVIAPTTGIVFDLVGANDITMRGLVISCTTTRLITGGFGTSRFDGAINGTTSGSQFENITVRNVGGWGIKTDGDNNRFKNCEVINTGAGGIRSIGEDNIVEQNLIHDIGVIFPSAIALWEGGEDNIFRHNEIYNTSYTGIASNGDRAIIEYNYIYDTMKELNDGGSIYITFCKDTIVRGNEVHGVGGGGNSHAFYFDEQAEDCILENNLAINSAWPFQSHWVPNCFIRNNVFIDDGPQLFTFPKSQNVHFEKNILIADDILLRPSTYGFEVMSNNIIYSRTDTIKYEEQSTQGPIVTSIPFEPREGTIFADPKFIDWENGNYNFAPDSPAPGMGIEPIDVSSAGR